MEKNLDFEIIQAYSFDEARDIIEENDDFFVTLCDLNLPDAPNGEIVDYVLSCGLPVIVLSGNDDEEMKSSVLEKDIVDYVYKGSAEDVNYIFLLIKRLSKNRDIKVMFVDDSMLIRKEAKKILKSQMFKTIIAAHGEEALGYFQNNKDIKIIVTDFKMPVLDGIELTRVIREEYNRDDVAIIAMVDSCERGFIPKFLKTGADDFLTKPFGKKELVGKLENIYISH